MKKIITLLTALTVTFFAFAQEWDSTYCPADELKGTSAYTIYCYECAIGSVLYTDNTNNVMVRTEYSFFDYDEDYFVEVLIGLYKKDVLIDRINIDMLVVSPMDVAVVSDYISPGVGKRIIRCLESGGSVRFIIPCWNKSSLDITAPARVK